LLVLYWEPLVLRKFSKTQNPSFVLVFENIEHPELEVMIFLKLFPIRTIGSYQNEWTTQNRWRLKTWDFFYFVSWCPFVKQKFSWIFHCRRQIKHLKTSDAHFISLSSILYQFLSCTKRNLCSLHRRRVLPGFNVLVNEDGWPCDWHWETWKGPQIYPSPIQKNHTIRTVTLTAISVISSFIYLSSAIHLLQISIQSLHILPSLPCCTLLILPTHISAKSMGCGLGLLLPPLFEQQLIMADCGFRVSPGIGTAISLAALSSMHK
jgi:hypothetical protein